MQPGGLPGCSGALPLGEGSGNIAWGIGWTGVCIGILEVDFLLDARSNFDVIGATLYFLGAFRDRFLNLRLGAEVKLSLLEFTM